MKRLPARILVSSMITVVSGCKQIQRPEVDLDANLSGFDNQSIEICATDGYAPFFDFLQSASQDGRPIEERELIETLADSEGFLEQCNHSELSWPQQNPSFGLNLADPFTEGRAVLKIAKGAATLMQGGRALGLGAVNGGRAAKATIATLEAAKPVTEVMASKSTKIFKGATVARDFRVVLTPNLAQNGFNQALRPLEGSLENDLSFLKNLLQKMKKANLDKKKDLKDFKDDIDRLSEIRLRFKELRTAFISFAQGEKAPDLTTRTPVILGHIVDDFKNGTKAADRLERDTKLLRQLLGDDSFLASLKSEFRGFRPRSNQEMFEYLRTKLDHLREISQGGQSFRSPDYHAIRKEVGSVQSILLSNRPQGASAEYDDALRVLSSINGKMGKVHDELVAGRVTKTANYDKEKVKISKDILELFNNVLKHLHLQAT